MGFATFLCKMLVVIYTPMARSSSPSYLVLLLTGPQSDLRRAAEYQYQCEQPMDGGELGGLGCLWVLSEPWFDGLWLITVRPRMSIRFL